MIRSKCWPLGHGALVQTLEESVLAQSVLGQEGCCCQGSELLFELALQQEGRFLICANKWDTWTLSFHIQCFTIHLRHLLCHCQGCRLLLSVLVTSPCPHLTHHRGTGAVVSSRKKWWCQIVLAQITTLPGFSSQVRFACFLLLLCISSEQFSSIVCIFSSQEFFHAH